MNIDYIAGFFDGEGCIAVKANKVRTTITQTNEEVLNEIRDFLKVGRVMKLVKRKDHWKDCWLYYTGGNRQSYEVLLKLKDHLIVKKQKAIETIDLLEKYFYDLDIKSKFRNQVLFLVGEGKSYREIEKLLNISKQTVCNIVKKFEGVV